MARRFKKDRAAAERLRLAEMRDLQPVDPQQAPASNNRAQRRAAKARQRRGSGQC
jgi:hypothetical protein